MTIKTLLVANRGEIARRIFRTAKSMGITCIAVYTDTDSNEPFVREADKAIRLSTNYLDQKEISMLLTEPARMQYIRDMDFYLKMHHLQRR